MEPSPRGGAVWPWPIPSANPRYVESAAVGLFFAGVFISLRSNDYLAVDGALRCLEVYKRQEVFFHGNNHLLYPFDIFVWWQLVSAMGFQADGPLGFIKLMQVLNCLAGAGCIAVLYCLAHLATASRPISLGIATAYAFSRAFLLHVTNTAEAMVGLFWSLAAVLVLTYALNDNRRWPILVSGMLFSLAMATYQSMILLAPAAIVLIWKWPWLRPAERKPASSPAFRLAVFVAGGLTAAAVIYVYAYSFMGASGAIELIKKFLVVEGGSVYGGWSFSKVISLAVGLARNIFFLLPPGYAGLRSVWQNDGSGPWIAWLSTVTLCFYGFLLLAAWTVCKSRRPWDRRERAILWSIIAGLLPTLAAALYWDPVYDKLLLQPVACMIFFTGLCLKVVGCQRMRRVLALLALSLLVLEVGSNLAWAVPSRLRETPNLRSAQTVAQIVGNQDLLVADWDGVSVLYGAVWGGQRRVLSLPTEACESGTAPISALRRAMAQARSRGGRTYFLGILDLNEPAWNAFLGRRCGLPYAVLAPYRAHSRIVAKFPYKGSTITLRVLEDGLR